jgi:hypothetical protein
MPIGDSRLAWSAAAGPVGSPRHDAVGQIEHPGAEAGECSDAGAVVGASIPVGEVPS